MSLENKRSAWITWEKQIRNKSMSTALDVPLYEVTTKSKGIFRYASLTFRTISIIRNNQIDLLFVQNPSIVLSFVSVTLKRLFRTLVIVDAHNAGIYPMEGRNKILNSICRYICRNADCTIVSNSQLAKVVSDWEGNPFVMTDPIPTIESQNIADIPATAPYLLFICTWSEDEPFMEVIKAAGLLESTIDIYITGSHSKALTQADKEDLPKNVKLLGFVSEPDYFGYFRHSVLAMDLTTRDNCLVCGAYEAIALKKPTIISDSVVNRETFRHGFVYTKNSAESIARSVDEALTRIDRLESEIEITANHHNEQTKNATRQLVSLVLEMDAAKGQASTTS